MNKFLNFLKITAEIILIILFILFEELIWKIFALPVKNWIIKRKILESVKVKIEKQGTYETLVIFLVPLIIAELMGLYSAQLFISGSILMGIVIYTVKIPVAGITFWIFSFTKEKLLTIDWFKTLYDLLIRFLDWIKSTAIYKRVKDKILAIKQSIKNLMPGSGHMTEEINHIYVVLKSLFNRKKRKEVKVETVDKKVDTKK